MTKVTVGVYKSYRNGGRNRFHRKKTSKHWKHYFFDVDEDGKVFGSEWVSAFKAQILKRKQQYKRTFYCSDCGHLFTAYIPKKQHELDECPHCNG